MAKNLDLLAPYVDEYYKNIIRNSNLNGVSFSYYKSLRGYFKHSTMLTSIKEKEFGVVDYRVWERILTKIKSGRIPAQSGGLFFRFSDYSDLCVERSWYRCRVKLISLELLIPTPFKDYYILNPAFIIKLYNPKAKKEEK